LVVAVAAFYFGTRSVASATAAAHDAVDAAAPAATPIDRDYYAVGLVQAQLSFRLSLIAAGVGFALILYATWTAISPKDVDLTRAVIPLVAGTVSEAVAALFFSQSNRTREMMLALLDRLREDSRRIDAIRLGSEISDKSMRARVQASMALAYAGVDKGELRAVLLAVDPEEPSRAAGGSPTP
jgi:hypothetical protein